MKKIIEADPDSRRELGADFPRNCPVRETTADGDSVGRCWFWLGDDGNTCPRHGDVSEQPWPKINRKS